MTAGKPPHHPISFSHLQQTAHSGNLEQMNQELEQTNHKLQDTIQELHTSTSYLRHILSNISQGLIFINKAKIVTTFNKNAEALLGRAAIEVLFQPYDLTFEDSQFGFSIGQALETQTVPAHHLTSVQLADGTNRQLEVEARYVLPARNIIPSSHLDANLDYTEGLLILVRDVTELHRLKALTERNDRLKALGEMAAMVAHEIRNPLGGIKGFASLLRRDLSDHPRLQEMASYIVEGTERLNRLVTQILAYARPINPVFATVDVKQLVETLRTEVMQDEKLSAGIRIDLIATAPEYLISADAQMLQGALLNLIVNAIEAMPEGGVITIRLSEQGTRVRIQIIDTGCGISKANLSRLFSPFFTTKPSGNGFGLADVQKVVLAHNGTIEVSSHENRGTTFTIELPRQ